MTLVVKKIGGSVAVIIPAALARQMGLSEGAAVDVTTSADAIVMRRAGRRARRPLNEIVNQINPSAYRRHNREFANDAPVGKEIW